MTWPKYGVEYADECFQAGLNDAAFRTHTEGIAWIYRVEAMNMRFPKNVVRRFAGSLDYEQAIKELLDARFWRDRGTEWEIVHHAGVVRQSLQAQRHKREQDAERKRRERRKKARKVTPDVTRDITQDVAEPQTDSQPLRERGAGDGEKPASLRAVEPGDGGAAA